jgi:hypothetical protein
VLVDDELFSASSEVSQVDFLLRMLNEESIEANPYSFRGGAFSLANESFDPSNEANFEAGWITIRASPTEARHIARFKRGQNIEEVTLPTSSPFFTESWLRPDPDTLSREHNEEKEQAMAMLVARYLLCDLLITERSFSIDIARDFWGNVGVMTVNEATPTIGLYLRRRGRFIQTPKPRLGHLPLSRDTPSWGSTWFYGNASRSLFQARFEWEITIGKSEKSANSQELQSLNVTMYHRIGQVLRSRDSLFALLAISPDSFEHGSLVADEVDRLLVFSLGAIDVMAEIVAGILNTSTKRPSWSDPQWIKQVAERIPTTQSIFDFKGKKKMGAFKVLSELRNSIHSEAISQRPTIFVVGEMSGQVLLPIPIARQAEVETGMEEDGGKQRWGWRAPSAGAGASINAGEFAGTLIESVVGFIHRIMVDVSRLDVSAKSGPMDRKHGRPLATDERYALWQLGLTRPL